MPKRQLVGADVTKEGWRCLNTMHHSAHNFGLRDGLMKGVSSLVQLPAISVRLLFGYTPK
ncbi:MAG: hypothetical protein JWM99_1672 [Verrucomicrobiales bacterium]|nr:hypothetical protein [Verrucomicrobiales bacterium]